jgi:hypothetical protein
MLCYRMDFFTQVQRMLNVYKRLRSSRVDRATHNRLVTGSNPVGARFSFSNASLAAFCVLILPAVSAASAQDLRPKLPLSGTSANQSNNSSGANYSGPDLPTADMPSTPMQVPQTPNSDASGAPLRPVIQQNTMAPSATGGSGKPASWPPYDTLPLGVNQFQAPETQLNLKGPVGTILSVTDQFIQNKPCRNCTAVKVKVQNFSENAIIVDGERAQAQKSGAAIFSLSEDDAMHSSGRQFTDKQKALLAATFVGTLGFMEPILQDHYTTSKTDFPISYGLNETRRRLEDRRLSRRIILPGEDTEGVIYFPGDKFSFDSIKVPLLTYPLGIPTGTLEIARNAPPINTPDTGVQPGPNAPLINKPYDPSRELIQRTRLREE